MEDLHIDDLGTEMTHDEGGMAVAAMLERWAYMSYVHKRHSAVVYVNKHVDSRTMSAGHLDDWLRERMA